MDIENATTRMRQTARSIDTRVGIDPRPRKTMKVEEKLLTQLEKQIGHSNPVFVSFQGVSSELKIRSAKQNENWSAFVPLDELLETVLELREVRVLEDGRPWFSLLVSRQKKEAPWEILYSYEGDLSGENFDWLSKEACHVDMAMFPRGLDSIPNWFAEKLGITV